ncbi:type IV pilus modification PilV family protein [Domibacillus iocasae]|uniref:Prepilin-type N-terminal cleavage/methylation domain-containing protein n=1 Tax=Domibacillus iocasae TaxID=1714016 RepID=A0A1E7DME3_9BACI|nr:prepilin-type N-terminal cleavage/methylation domain-containing protein [Domibacillus iocasae]OES44224.1 hypothetical protein BA724_07995 [Domibacillus iocasae]
MCEKLVKDQQGLTFIEILLSLVILSIVLMFFSTMFIQSNRTNSNTGQLLDATYVAQECMERAIQKTNASAVSCTNHPNYIVEIITTTRDEGGRFIKVVVYEREGTNTKGQLEATLQTIAP